MGCLGTVVTVLVGAGWGTGAQAALGGLRRHRPLPAAGVAADQQGLRFPLTLSVIAAQGQLSWAGASEEAGGECK